ncbi:MAG TPA: dihydrodipicolinate synthase family protein [Opitutaceae bacterium]|nr:dihydrodipicolinate synthase family protein [Opitutaceae bacterium]
MSGETTTLKTPSELRAHLRAGQAIPALPLALTRTRRWDERRQRALVRYYIDAEVGGLAVGVHSTQFAIRDSQVGLYRPVLQLAAETAEAWKKTSRATNPLAMIAGLCGRTQQAVAEARTARQLGYHAGLLSLGAWKRDDEAAVLKHCQRVAAEIPLVGFYLQPAVGGRVFSYEFWQRFVEIPDVVAVKVAPFDRYRTNDVVRAVLEGGRDDVALYTGNDDNILGDLLTPFSFGGRTRFFDGGLLGQWGVWTQRAVQLFREVQRARMRRRIDPLWLTRNAAWTDANAAIFDSAHGFSGCLPGIHEVLRRAGLLQSVACLDPHEQLSTGQADEITRVARENPWLTDEVFTAENRHRWLA